MVQRKGAEMAKKYLIVVDMQRDFVNGALGTAEAAAILPKVVEKVFNFQGEVLFTRDTHFENYLTTGEGKLLPVEHCIKGTSGWELMEELEVFRTEHNCVTYDKLTFGSRELAQDLLQISEEQGIDSIEFIGLCTDICVVSNVLMTKAFLPEVEIKVDAACCAGVTPEKHAAALETMRSCQIMVDND